MSTRARTAIVVASVCLAVLTGVVPSASADPTSPSVPPHRPLNGVGSPITQDVMNALSKVIVDGSGNRLVSSWNAGPAGSSITTGIGAVNNSVCTITRPSGSDQAVVALRRSLTNGPVSTPDGCLQFARSSSTAISSDGSLLSLRRFAIEGVSYAVRSDGNVPFDLTRAEIQAIYNCAPEWALTRPKLPRFGSETRSFFISQILGLVDSPTVTTGRSCISEVDGDNSGVLLTDQQAIAPYSVSQYNAQINRVVQDVHGRSVLGRVNAVAPNVMNTLHAPAGLTYVVRDDSGVPLDLSRTELADTYRANGTPGSPACQGFRPLLPASGATRTAFLGFLGVTPGSCVTTVAAENDGRALTTTGHLLPYSIDTYNRQVSRVIADVHGRAVLGSVNAVSPNVLNGAQLGARALINVFPTSQEAIAPTSTVFVGPGSLVCQQPNVITRYGFALLPPGTCGTSVLSVGHFEIDMDYDSSTLTLDLREEVSNPPNDDLPTANGLIVAPPRALNTVPSGSGFACLGSPGSTVYLLPQSHNPDLAAPAFNTEDVPPGALSNNKVTLELVSWSVPPGARFAAYNTSVSGPLFRFNTNSAPGCQVTTFPGGGMNTGVHLHTWFAFTAAGTYTLTFRATATTTGGVPKSSGNQTYTFAVG